MIDGVVRDSGVCDRSYGNLDREFCGDVIVGSN